MINYLLSYTFLKINLRGWTTQQGMTSYARPLVSMKLVLWTYSQFDRFVWV